MRTGTLGLCKIKYFIQSFLIKSLSFCLEFSPPQCFYQNNCKLFTNGDIINHDFSTFNILFRNMLINFKMFSFITKYMISYKFNYILIIHTEWSWPNHLTTHLCKQSTKLNSLRCAIKKCWYFYSQLKELVVDYSL